MSSPKPPHISWKPISQSLRLLFTRKRLLAISCLLFIVTVVVTLISYQLSITLIDDLSSHFFKTPAPSSSILSWIQTNVFVGLRWIYLILTRIIAFYLAFTLAYILTSPGYVLLSTAAEKLFASEQFEVAEGVSLKNFLLDLIEGLKIGLVGLIITPVVLVVNFIPIIGQISGFLIYTYYSALMFVDYPSSRRRWSLGRKIKWVRSHPMVCFKLGLLPAIVSMIPVLNIFLIAVLFPILTIHATLNFTSIELPPDNPT